MAKKKTNLEQENPPQNVTLAPESTDAKQDPPINLNKPLKWKKATARQQKMLRNLQGNILKGHGREHTWNVFFELGSDQKASRRVLRELGNFHVTDAYKQLLEAEAFREEGKEAGTFCSVFLSAEGYRALGLTFAPPAGTKNAAFGPGMKDASSVSALADPDVADWEAPFQKPIHGMILVADDNTDRGSATATSFQSLLLGAGAKIQHIQPGTAIRNSVGNGLEHFGYIDGRSQPLMLVEDVEKESRDEGRAHWDPQFPLSTALVRDPLRLPPSGADAEDPEAYGSFFIFRKLEQHVAAFKKREQELADKLGLVGDDRELAGAFVVGRFEDGTPVTMASSPKGRKEPQNDFDYSDDAAASRCPFHAHIRKTNPRGAGGFELEPEERTHLMARRGIPYEDKSRLFHPDGLPKTQSTQEFMEKVFPFLPKDGVGLLFMAYNSNLDSQFVFTQQAWANNANFPGREKPVNLGITSGVDGVIGQQRPPTDAATGQEYPNQWDDPDKGVHKTAQQKEDFKGFVTMKGGEYFFAPSVLFLRGL